MCSCKFVVLYNYRVATGALANMVLSRILVSVIFMTFVQGFEESSGDKDYSSVLGSGSGQSTFNNESTNDMNCDPYTLNYSDCSFYHELANLTSNGLVSIMNDVMLLSVVPLVGLKNVTIAGHDNPTVNCNDAGGIRLDDCCNCTIMGITWKKCGTKNSNMPAMELYNSSNILIQNCSFQHTITQAITVSEMSGIVTIDDCKFVFNNHFEGHGTTIHYLSKIKLDSKFQFIISNCNFTHNGASVTSSIVYIGRSNNISMEQVCLTNLVFLSNQGTPIYISHQSVIASGNIVFEGNEASIGGGIFITNHSSVEFQNSNMNFMNNEAVHEGGALYVHNSDIIFGYDSKLTINGNQARLGGAFYILRNSDVTFKGNSNVTINSNQAKSKGGALYILGNSNVIFEGNCTVTVNNNQAIHGGALGIEHNSHITFDGNSVVTINNNQGEREAGALYIRYYSQVTFKGNSKVNINDNQAAKDGGALYIWGNSNITFEETSEVTINNNQAESEGGALYIRGSNITFEENSTVAINNNQARFGGAFDIWGSSYVTFEENSKVTINNNQAESKGGALYIWYHSHVTFEGNSLITINNNKAKHDGGALYVLDNSNVIFEENCIVTINDNQAECGALYFWSSNVTFEGNSNVTIYNNEAESKGGALYTGNYSYVTFKENTTVTINDNQAERGALYFWSSNVTFEENCIVTINDNQVERGALYFWSSNVTFEGNSNVTIYNNEAESKGGALYTDNYSYVTFKENTTVTINNNQAKGPGGALYIGFYSNVTFKGNSTVTIIHNESKGGTLYIEYFSNVTFEGTSTVTINNNSNNQVEDEGGALDIEYYCNVLFEGSSLVTINNNLAKSDGGALYICCSSNVTFEENSIVTINNNQAENEGGAIFVWRHSHVSFEGNSTLTVNNNHAKRRAGAFSITYYSHVTFKGNSSITIYDNQAEGDGGALYIGEDAGVAFKGNSSITINNNQAESDGGALYIEYNSQVTFEGNSLITMDNNQAASDGGALYIGEDADVAFAGNCTVTITNNQASLHGGVLVILGSSNMIFRGNSKVSFDNNMAKNSGGALYLTQNSSVSFEEDTVVVFSSNTASIDGGVLYAQDNCHVIIKGNSIAMFNNNEALGDGGALYINSDGSIVFQESSIVNFDDNRAKYFGGALHSKYNSNIMFEENCTITFNHNEAPQGGAIFTRSNAVFKENSTALFDNNKAILGGALHTANIAFKGNTAVTFENNEAELNGGALYSYNSNISVTQNSVITFTNNSAENGGAVFASASILLVSEYSTVTFDMNTARQDGGAIYFNDQINARFKNSSTVTLTSNTANNRAGALYSKITQNTKYFNISEINFRDNTAGVAGNLLYIEIPKSCNSSCLTNRVIGISNEILSDEYITTTPKILKLYDTAKCIGNDSVGCNKYYIGNIMLGQEITVYPCLLDYYNKPAEVTQFRITSENHQNYFFQGSEYTSISCNHTVEGISIVGNKTVSSLPLNYSILFTSNITRQSLRKVISTNLTVGLSPCHPGFQYDIKSQRCECYNNSEIVSCSGSRSTIKRGYWFGHVTGIPTVIFCPINYCNFTCCKTTNGYYHLSPDRVNQCKSHRSGTACGSCENGHTLSFDSAECISVNKCNTGMTILVVALTILYWFAVVVTAFIIMYYQVGIGYFYAITYYYSVVDVMLNQHTDLSNGLYNTITIMSSIAKVTPQFLGQLCLFKNMSGIDQQFIHYLHPLAVSVILIIISWLARHSKKLSTFISRGIIHAICFLLLLSYTSVATTSLLLLRSLTFADVDNVYTYLSPDIHYFHGRHLVYGITAIILGLLIVIGLPLLLLTEPFLNSKINFFRVKPLLDQFQGCYKDKYRWFAAYYMICRLIVIVIIIANISEGFISRYLLITTSTIIALVHVTVRPYADNILNTSDGAILHLMVLVTALPLFEYFDTLDFSLVIGISFVLVILPLVQFGVMKVYTNKQNFIQIIKYIINYFHDEDVPVNDIAKDALQPSNHVDLVIDDNMRKNATICEM